MKNYKILIFSCFIAIAILVSILIKEKNTPPPSLVISEEFKEELKNQLKEQVLAELNDEVTQLVKNEVETYLANYKPDLNEDELQQLTKLDNSNVTLSKDKQEAIRRIIHEILEQDTRTYRVSDEELDKYIGAAIELEPSIPGGYGVSRADFTLAQADTSQNAYSSSSSDNTQLDETTAGDSEPKAESIERTLVQKGGLLIPKGTMIGETSFAYSQFSSNAININGFVVADIFFLGTQNIEEIKRNIFLNTLSFKYGLWHNLQAEIKVPTRYQHTRRETRSAGSNVLDHSTDDFGGLGDVEIAFSRQIAWEKGWIPDTLATMSVKTTTGRDPYGSDRGIGTGHWAIRGGVVMVKSSDPAVIFGGLNYAYNFEEDNLGGGLGKIKPGDTIGFSLGTAIALSYQTAINFSYEHSVTEKLLRNDRVVQGTFVNSASFKTGFTWALNESTSIDFSAGVGLTTDSPDVTVTLRIPHTF